MAQEQIVESNHDQLPANSILRRRGHVGGKKQMGAGDQIGMSNLLNLVKSNIMKSRFHSRYLLTVPDEILKKNPDKHFVFLDMNELQKNGMHHPGGYTLYKTVSDKENLNKSSFDGGGIDPYIRRRELVLAYLPKEEHDYRVFEEAVVRGNFKLEDLINKNIPIEFSPEASVETTKAGVDDHLIKEILTNESVRHRLGLESLDIKHVEKE